MRVDVRWAEKCSRMTARACRARSLPRLLSTKAATAWSTSSGAWVKERWMRSSRGARLPTRPERTLRMILRLSVSSRERSRPPVKRLSRRWRSKRGAVGWGARPGLPEDTGCGPNSSSWRGERDILISVSLGQAVAPGIRRPREAHRPARGVVFHHEPVSVAKAFDGPDLVPSRRQLGPHRLRDAILHRQHVRLDEADARGGDR